MLNSEIIIFHLRNWQQWTTLIMFSVGQCVGRWVLTSCYIETQGHTFRLLKICILDKLASEDGSAFLWLCKGQLGNIYWNFKCIYSLASNCSLRLFFSIDKYGHICQDSHRKPQRPKWPTLNSGLMK